MRKISIQIEKDRELASSSSLRYLDTFDIS
jgi:hypothetical protein